MAKKAAPEPKNKRVPRTKFFEKEIEEQVIRRMPVENKQNASPLEQAPPQPKAVEPQKRFELALRESKARTELLHNRLSLDAGRLRAVSCAAKKPNRLFSHEIPRFPHLEASVGAALSPHIVPIVDQQRNAAGFEVLKLDHILSLR